MVDVEKLKEEQLRLAKKVVLKDSFGDLNLIAGAEQAFHNGNVISAVVVCDYRTMEVKEKVFAVVKAKVPYISGFMAYREGPAVSEAYAKLQQKPDVMLIKGNGILHPRKCGMASHIGILLDQAAIGIAKQLLLGGVKNNKVYVDKEARAQAIVTREHAKPIYVSPGHKITLKTSVEIVKKCIKFPHKLPEPLHLAHRYANEIKEKIEKNEIRV